jgi:Integral membrane protein CcmA involved in cell shape determination
MLGGKKNQNYVVESGTDSKPDTTIIGSNTSFDGTLKSSGIVRIDGTLTGELHVDGTILVGEGGKVNGNIKTNKITIGGVVEGNVHCSDTLNLMPSGKLHGDIEVKNINIENGAVFDGKCVMINTNNTGDQETESIEEVAAESI